MTLALLSETEEMLSFMLHTLFRSCQTKLPSENVELAHKDAAQLQTVLSGDGSEDLLKNRWSAVQLKRPFEQRGDAVGITVNTNALGTAQAKKKPTPLASKNPFAATNKTAEKKFFGKTKPNTLAFKPAAKIDDDDIQTSGKRRRGGGKRIIFNPFL